MTSETEKYMPLWDGQPALELRDVGQREIGRASIADGCIALRIDAHPLAGVIASEIAASKFSIGWHPAPPANGPQRFRLSTSGASATGEIAPRAEDGSRWSLSWSAPANGPVLELMLAPVPARPARPTPDAPSSMASSDVAALLAEIAKDDQRWPGPHWEPYIGRVSRRFDGVWLAGTATSPVMQIVDIAGRTVNVTDEDRVELAHYVARLREREPRLVAALKAAIQDLGAERAQHRADNEGAASALATAEHERMTAEDALAAVRGQLERAKQAFGILAGPSVPDPDSAIERWLVHGGPDPWPELVEHRIADLESALHGLVARVERAGGYADHEDQEAMRAARAALGGRAPAPAPARPRSSQPGPSAIASAAPAVSLSAAPPLTDPIRKALAEFNDKHAALHTEWTAAVGTPGYIRAPWRDRDNALTAEYRARLDALGYSGPLCGVLRPQPGDPVCSSCGTFLMFSARQRADGLCGPCSRKANGTQTPGDRWNALGSLAMSSYAISWEPPPMPALGLRGPLTREQAVELAQAAALQLGADHAYTPRSAGEAAVWQPHDWVVAAILTAAARRGHPLIGRLCRPYQDSDRVARVSAVEPGDMLRVREPGWTPHHVDFRVHADDVLWFDDVAAARHLDDEPQAAQELAALRAALDAACDMGEPMRGADDPRVKGAHRVELLPVFTTGLTRVQLHERWAELRKLAAGQTAAAPQNGGGR